MQTESILRAPDQTKLSPASEKYFSHKNIENAWLDVKNGCLHWRIWVMLAYQDIRLKYRRSVLGPLWLTLSMAITVYSIGFLYSHLFNMKIEDYFPYLVSGMLAWSFIASNLNELTDSFIAHENLIKQIKLPYTLHLHRIVTRNLIVFIHNMLVMIPIYLIFHHTAKINLNTLFLIPSLLIIYFNMIFIGLLLAIVATRFRDISQLIKNLIQVIFFITPVMWKPDLLPANKLIFIWGNPVYTLIELIRAPMLGQPPSWTAVYICLGFSIISCAFPLILFIHYRKRIIYWL